MNNSIPAHPQPGSVAAVVLLVSLVAVVGLAIAVAVHPVPLGGVGFLAVVLGVVGVVAGISVEGVAR